MTLFKPMWVTPTASAREGASSGEKKSKAGAGGNFKPLWLELPSARGFLVGHQVVTAVVDVAPGVAPLPSTADGDDAVSQRGDSAAVATAGAEPDDSGAISATQIITREEHVRLLALERQAGVEVGKVEGLAQAKKICRAKKRRSKTFCCRLKMPLASHHGFSIP